MGNTDKGSHEWPQYAKKLQNAAFLAWFYENCGKTLTIAQLEGCDRLLERVVSIYSLNREKTITKISKRRNLMTLAYDDGSQIVFDVGASPNAALGVLYVLLDSEMFMPSPRRRKERELIMSKMGDSGSKLARLLFFERCRVASPGAEESPNDEIYDYKKQALTTFLRSSRDELLEENKRLRRTIDTLTRKLRPYEGFGDGMTYENVVNEIAKTRSEAKRNEIIDFFRIMMHKEDTSKFLSDIDAKLAQCSSNTGPIVIQHADQVVGYNDGKVSYQ